jgi:hypothetical protein
MGNLNDASAHLDKNPLTLDSAPLLNPRDLEQFKHEIPKSEIKATMNKNIKIPSPTHPSYDVDAR